MYSIDLSYSIVPSEAAQTGFGNPLIRELEAIESEKSLKMAAQKLGVSYRYFWGQIEFWEEKFGQKLVIREQGRPAQLSPLGTKLLWAEKSVMARYSVQIEKLRTELASAVAAACDPNADIITVAGCYDPWLSKLPAALFSDGIIADLKFSTSREGLVSLHAGEADMAGFNFPRGSGPDSTAAGTFAQLIDPASVGLCRFASRTQGLAVAAGNPLGIEQLSDVIDRSLRYAGRPVGTGTHVLLRDLLGREGLPGDLLDGTKIVETSHRGVALAVASGRADAGLCVADAAQAARIDFVPLAVEDYYLAWRLDRVPASLPRLLKHLRTAQWQMTASAFAGMSGEDCGACVDQKQAFGWWS